ncbi:hypothetical protein Scep_001708 [Stephania cephalantha]|uniref:Uncharacterized protein n=1 Tax=Stephania cephalantha TaxID=152367 RepID=A0AAP0L9X9_9MAGN
MLLQDRQHRVMLCFLVLQLFLYGHESLLIYVSSGGNIVTNELSTKAPIIEE